MHKFRIEIKKKKKKKKEVILKKIEKLYLWLPWQQPKEARNTIAHKAFC